MGYFVHPELGNGEDAESFFEALDAIGKTTPDMVLWVNQYIQNWGIYPEAMSSSFPRRSICCAKDVYERILNKGDGRTWIHM